MSIPGGSVQDHVSFNDMLDAILCGSRPGRRIDFSIHFLSPFRFPYFSFFI